MLLYLNMLLFCARLSFNATMFTPTFFVVCESVCTYTSSRCTWCEMWRHAVVVIVPPHTHTQPMDPQAAFLGAEDGMSHGPMISHISHNYFSAPGSNSNTGYNTPHHPVAQSGYNTPHGALGYSHPSTGIQFIHLIRT